MDIIRLLNVLLLTFPDPFFDIPFRVPSYFSKDNHIPYSRIILYTQVPPVHKRFTLKKLIVLPTVIVCNMLNV